MHRSPTPPCRARGERAPTSIDQQFRTCPRHRRELHDRVHWPLSTVRWRWRACCSAPKPSVKTDYAPWPYTPSAPREPERNAGVVNAAADARLPTPTRLLKLRNSALTLPAASERRSGDGLARRARQRDRKRNRVGSTSAHFSRSPLTRRRSFALPSAVPVCSSGRRLVRTEHLHRA